MRLRAVAAIIDTAILFVVAYLIAFVTGGTTAEGFQLQGGPFFLWLVIALLYYIAMEAKIGATAGKRLIGLKVARLDGSSPPDWRTSIVRNVLRLVDGLVFYLLGAILIWTSDKKQRLGDRVAGTVVLRG
ncbi:MAG: RDD family protein [Chromatiales bacterium]